MLELLLSAVVAAGKPGAAPNAGVRPLPAPFLSGVSFAMTNHPDQAYDSPAARRALDALRNRGADAISIMPFAFQRSSGAPALSWRLRHPSSENDAQVAAAIRAAKERGLRVLVKPQVWVPRSWPGAIDPGSEEAFASWWRDYREFILHHARTAAAEGADGFCVGTELTRLQTRPEWGELIGDVRRVFAGFVVYAANWDAAEVPFADRLDAVGVDLYAPLSSEGSASDGDLFAGAERIVAGLDALAARTGRPVLLTEVGFPARAACWVRPNEESRGPADPEAQRRAAHALLSALSASRGVAGLFWWKSFSDGAPASPDDASFRLTGRPAEQELFAFFARRRASARPLPPVSSAPR